MSRKLLFLTVLFLLCFSLLFAAEGDLDFALFKRTVSPVLRWGENGLLTVPKALTIGRMNSYIGLFGQQAGKINDQELYLTSLTVLVGTSSDVEIGYTRRQLIWDDLYFTDMSMDTIHLKTRILDFDTQLLPAVSLGVNGVSLVDNQFTNKNDILFNPYLVATSVITLLPNILEVSVTALAETIMSGDSIGKPQFSLGADVNLLNMVYVFGEMQGMQSDLKNFDLSESTNEMVNVGAKVKIGWVSAGVGLFNVVRESAESGNIIANATSSTFNLDSAQYMASIVVSVPIGNFLTIGY